MDWWDQVRLTIQAFLDQHGVLAAFVLVLIEESGLPVPVPGDFLMLALGVRARQGQVPLWQALLVLEAATVLGATFLYILSARGGRGLVYRYGRYMHLTPERLERAERWLARRGVVAIIVGRLTPGLRTATVIACGVFGIPFWRFLLGMTVGGFLYILAYTLLGYMFGPSVLLLIERVHLPLGFLGSLVPLIVLIVWIVRARRGLHLRQTTDAGFMDRGRRWRDGAVAGGLATLASTLTMNVLVHVAGDLTLLAPGELVERARGRLAVFALIRVIGPVLLVAAIPAFILVGVVWGAVYGQWVEPYLHVPDWLSGLGFALLPLCVALVVVLPLLDNAAPDLGSLGPLAAISEVVRHAVYGATLGLAYPLRLARLPPLSRPAIADIAPSPAASQTWGTVSDSS